MVNGAELDRIASMSLARERIDNLRSAIRNNRISFPSQTPIFQQSRSDIQWRLVLLYFVRGWTCKQLSVRYGLTRQRIEQLIAEWVDSAVTHGYMQEILPPGELAADWLLPVARPEGALANGEATAVGSVANPF